GELAPQGVGAVQDLRVQEDPGVVVVDALVVAPQPVAVVEAVPLVGVVRVALVPEDPLEPAGLVDGPGAGHRGDRAVLPGVGEDVEDVVQFGGAGALGASSRHPVGGRGDPLPLCGVDLLLVVHAASSGAVGAVRRPGLLVGGRGGVAALAASSAAPGGGGRGEDPGQLLGGELGVLLQVVEDQFAVGDALGDGQQVPLVLVEH